MNTVRGNDDHYFSADPSSGSRTVDYSFEHEGRVLSMTAESGVFASHGLDKATAVLLDTVRRQGATALADDAVVVDLGCGSGALACALAVSYPTARVIAVDVNERARALTTANAARNGLVNIEVLAPDEVPGDLSVSAIWSNPPIRIGKDALHDLLDAWLPRLADGGHALLVVGKNLGADSLAVWIASRGFVVERIASSKGFRVLHVGR